MSALVRLNCDVCGQIVDAPLPNGWAKISGETFVSGKSAGWGYDLCSKCYLDYGPTALNPMTWKTMIAVRKDKR